MTDEPNLAVAVETALRAPSVHNTQPWRWHIRPEAVELHADFNRHLPWTDPARRDLVLSCGAALHHLRVALAAQDLATRVDRLPDAESEGHLATVTVSPGTGGDQALARLLPALERRRTERRQMSMRPVPATAVAECVRQARLEGADLVPVATDEIRHQLAATLIEAAREQAVAPGYPAELMIWTHRYAGGRDGVPASHVAEPPVGLAGPSPLRAFAEPGLRQPHWPGETGPPDDAAELLVLVTAADSRSEWLRAGEALSAVLLTATQAGLATTPLSQAIEVESARRRLRRLVLDGSTFPQLIIRLGWPIGTAEELPASPRRDLSSVLLRG